MSMFPTIEVDAAPGPEMREALALVQRIGGQSLLDKVATIFRASAEERMEKLRDSMAAGDGEQVRRLAHAMKGSAAQVGAESLRALAESLEHEACQLDADALGHRYDRLVEALGLALLQLEAYRASGGRSA